MNIQEVLFKFLYLYPFYGNLLSKLNVKLNINIKTIIIQFFPKYLIEFNKTWFDALNNNQKIGVIKHELLHVILLHKARRGNRKKALWAISTDLAVNQFIEPVYLLEEDLTINKINNDLNIELKNNESAEFYYSFLIDYFSQFKITENDNKISIKMASGIHYSSEILDDVKLSQFQIRVIENSVSDSLNYSGKSENIKTELISSLNNNYSTSKVNWRKVIKKFLSKTGQLNIKKSYKRVSRRFSDSPGKIKSKGVKALIALDESGSMPDSIVENYIEELKIINKITGVDIQVVRFDNKCSDPVSINNFIKEEGRELRGGTSYIPIFKLADKLKIEQVIVFTDGDGEYPESVNQNVLWLLTEDCLIPPLFGEFIYF